MIRLPVIDQAQDMLPNSMMLSSGTALVKLLGAFHGDAEEDKGQFSLIRPALGMNRATLLLLVLVGMVSLLLVKFVPEYLQAMIVSDLHEGHR